MKQEIKGNFLKLPFCITGMKVKLHTFLTSVPDVSEWPASCYSHFTPGTQWIGGWVGPQSWSRHGGKEKSPAPDGNSLTDILFWLSKELYIHFWC
jgi:hypothetical protein